MNSTISSLKLIILVCFLVYINPFFCQELPPISSFSASQYDGDNQNWGISQSPNKSIYIANSRGLLKYNGSKWHLYNSPNETIMRSVAVVDDKIYTGCYMEFGFWEENAFGDLNYTSLSQTIKDKLIEDEQFWQILALDDWVLFKSLNSIYIYNSSNQSFITINSNTTITKMYKVGKSIYFQKLNEGIFEIHNGKVQLVSDAPSISSNRVVNIFRDIRGLVFLTSNDGFYILNENGLLPWETILNTTEKNTSIYSATKLKNNNYALGTISKGLMYLDKDGQLIYRIAQDSGLLNNTVLSIFQDVDKNVWLALDNGINCVNINSPFSIYNDKKGDLGTVYSAQIHDDYLYIGTNQGLFYRKKNSQYEFTFVKGTQGQVWSLDKINNVLFCGHNSGTYIINKGVAKKISDIEGTWSVKPISENLLLQGNYDGLYILEFKNNHWQLRNKINGFNISSRYFEFLPNNVLLVNHEYKGVFKLKINSDFTSVVKTEKDAIEKGLNSTIFKYQDNIYYAYKKGVFKYNTSKNTFFKDTILSKVYTEKNYTSGKLVKDLGTNKLWGFSKSELFYITPGKLNAIPEINRLTLPNIFKRGVANYENVLHLQNEKFLFGTSSGYAILDLDKLQEKSYTIDLSSVSNSKLDAEFVPVDKSKTAVFKNSYNNVSFSYVVPEYSETVDVLYQYKLEGFNHKWSDWTKNTDHVYKNLPSGDYTFKVRAKAGNNITSNIATYSFTIEKPWYLKPIMIIVYILIVIGLAFLLHYYNKMKFFKKEQKLREENKKELDLIALENQKRLISLENEKLQQDIDNKNRELAISTMSLIKKNEFLNSIKDEISGSDKTANLKSVLNTIDKNINNTDDWKFFQEAFNNADKDFLKKVKAKHNSLTPNDLKLCAYLRLNLSSKEIAPLLNISSRSVEVKRYRLRKKMNLKQGDSLTNYILSI